MRYISSILLFLILSPVLADDVVPVVQPPKISVQAVKGVEGTGKKDSPYQFDSNTVCVLMLPPEIKDEDLVDIEWDFEQAPTGIVILQENRMVAFPVSETGVFNTTAHGKAGYFKVWFEIKGPNGPPSSVNVRTRVTKALVGMTAKSDAIALAGTCQATKDNITNFKTTAELQVKFADALKSNGWHSGVYSDIQAVFNENIQPGESKDITDSERDRLIEFFSDVEAGAKAILK